jgi:hypothetical protein
MRLSVEKGAQRLSTPPSHTGNLGERSAGICQFREGPAPGRGGGQSIFYASRPRGFGISEREIRPQAKGPSAGLLVNRIYVIGRKSRNCVCCDKPGLSKDKRFVYADWIKVKVYLSSGYHIRSRLALFLCFDAAVPPDGLISAERFTNGASPRPDLRTGPRVRCPTGCLMRGRRES